MMKILYRLDPIGRDLQYVKNVIDGVGKEYMYNIKPDSRWIVNAIKYIHSDGMILIRSFDNLIVREGTLLKVFVDPIEHTIKIERIRLEESKYIITFRDFVDNL